MVSRETRCREYLALVRRWNASISLTARGEDSRLEAHVAESLALLPHLPQNLTRLIDLGSGQGFPAIPLAIETEIAIELVEADRRKAAFLQTALAQLQLRGHVYGVRAETLTLSPSLCVTARALADLKRLIQLARPFIAPGGVCLFPKGAAAELEVANVQDDTVTLHLVPRMSATASLVKVTMRQAA